MTAERAAADLVAIGHTSGTRRLRHLLDLLTVLDEAPPEEAHLLASPWTPAVDGAQASELVDRTLTYLFSQVEGEVRMSQAAALVGMSASGCSRAFQRASGQTFTETVRKLRLTHARHLLEQTDLGSPGSAAGSATGTCPTSTASSGPGTR